MHRRSFIKNTGSAGLFTLFYPSYAVGNFGAQVKVDLEEGFVKPPLSAYPQVLWFWMNGHVTKEGITLDLEAMKKVGIGGVFNFDAGTDIPAGPVQYLSEEWFALKKHAIQEAERLGLQFIMHNCPGWSASGGPWITPELSMQQVTWSELYVKGGQPVKVLFPQPFHKLGFYRDIAVLAIPSLMGEAPLQTFRAITEKGVVDKKKLTGEDPEGIHISADNPGQLAWIKFAFDAPYEARSITFLISSPDSSHQEGPIDYNNRTYVILQSSHDGEKFRDVVAINTGLESELATGDKFITFDFPAVKARFFRITSQNSRRFAQVRFSGITRLNQWMEKSGYRFQFTGAATSPIYHYNQQLAEEGSIVSINDILDVTSFIDDTGRFEWPAPAGNWTLLRIGYTPVGTQNRAAPDRGIGLECDKYSSTAFDFHFEKMIGPFLPLLQTLASKGGAGVEIDSYEARSQNWTPLFGKEFRQRIGYEITKYLPVLTGRIVENVETAERFLWDFRRTQAELIADHYYGRFATLCRAHQLNAYIEPYDRGPMEEMQIGAEADMNIGESFYGLHSILQSNRVLGRTIKLAASIAHINGQKIVGAEAFTAEPESGRWQTYPFAMKALGDKIFTEGINRMIIHRFAHQPHPTAAPGMTMGPWGIHFERTNTWWHQGSEWLKYVARCQSLLQQGKFVADLAYFTGEEANIYTRVDRNQLCPPPPYGYDYDVINAETIIKNAAIRHGRIVLNNGMSYRVLVLQEFKSISMELLLKLRELVQQGMILVGARPQYSLGLQAYSDKDAVFQEVIKEIWGQIDGNNITIHKTGKGSVYFGSPLTEILQELEIAPDFEAFNNEGKAPVCYIHRKSEDTDFFFISNQRRTFEQITCTFRVAHKQPELWDAATGRMIKMAFYETTGDLIRMPLQLEPYGSVIVVFRKPASSKKLQAVLRDNQVLVSTNKISATTVKHFPRVVNNFSISFWAKPEMAVMLQPSIYSEGIEHPWTDYFALYPLKGSELYGEGHATCGLTVGRNGIAVWEHGGEAPALAYSVPISISGWTHVTLVYREGVPMVYVAGKKAGEGKKSQWNVHPSTSNVYREDASYYNGDMTSPELNSKDLTEEEIKQLADRAPVFSNSPFVVEIAWNRKAALLFWQNGNYRLCYHSGKQKQLIITSLPEPKELAGPWLVQFPEGRGAPPEVELPMLYSLHKHIDAGVQYFSGTAVYKHSFTFSPYILRPEQLLYLDLGTVEVIAEVILNGKNLGILWKRPYRIEVTNIVKVGNNTLEVRVTNLWPNRLIGDEQVADPYQFSPAARTNGVDNLFKGGIVKVPEWFIKGMPKPEDGRVTFATWKHYHKHSPLLESGLIGPVKLLPSIIREL